MPRAAQPVGLNEVERDYIAFLAQRRNVSEETIRQSYVAARARFGFGSVSYKKLMMAIHDLLEPVFGEDSDGALVAGYQHHAPMHLYRFIGLNGQRGPAYLNWARYLLGRLGNRRPVVVDYGCGLAYVAFEVAKLAPDAVTYLLDVDGLVLEFTSWRFAQRGFDCRTIPVTVEHAYPTLPMHNVCIVAEVMEHLLKPMVAYQHIVEAMEPRGLLVAQFADHSRYTYHVTTDFAELRAAVARDFEPAGDQPYCWVKRGAGDGR